MGSRVALRKAGLISAFAFSLLLPLQGLALSPGGNGSGSTPTCTGNCGSPDAAPTEASLEAARGPYNFDLVTVRSGVKGFGGGRIYYPTNAQGKRGLIVIGPGFLFPETSIRWWGPKLASHGFVVFTINFNSVLDVPDRRARQYSNALDHAIALSQDPSSALYNKVDPDRLGASGWSMGGGGALKLSTMRPLKAIMPLAPWHQFAGTFSKVRAPTFIVACQFDLIAPVALHSTPMYEVIPGTTPKMFLLFAGENHWCANSGNSNNSVMGKLGVSWFKRHMDDDQRYDEFLCGPDHKQEKGVVSARDNCSNF